MNPHDVPTDEESRERAESTDRDALRELLMDVGLGLILLMVALALLLIVVPAVTR
ncbi:hypothetical protein [Micromonospora sp. DT227]|uniref:hypothetical protein n=1 Tax=Micromonospora sp. DT227 TaxID=3393433 RepID=UPI003CF3BF94